MTSPPSPPNRHRRRTVVAVAVLLLVLGGGLWWVTRPRIDPRLVGTWTYQRTHDRQVPAQRRFDADGLSYLIRDFETGSSANATPFRWRVVDNEVQLRMYHGDGWRGWLKNLTEAVNEIRGIQPEIIRFALVEVSDNSFTWQQAGKSSRPVPPARYVRAPKTILVIDEKPR